MSFSSGMGLNDDDKSIHQNVVGSFFRSASFMDIARQTANNDLSITVDSSDTLLNRISPSMSKHILKVKSESLHKHSPHHSTVFISQFALFVQFYYSRYSMVTMIIIVALALTAKQTSNPIIALIAAVSAVIYLVPWILIWSYPVLRYSAVHSFDLHLLLITSLTQLTCYVVFLVVNGEWHMMLAAIGARLLLFYVRFLGYTIEGGYFGHREKIFFLFICCLSTSWMLISYLIGSGVDSLVQYQDILLEIPGMNDAISLKDIVLLCYVNIAVFWWKKLILMAKHPQCILIATHPQIVWTQKDQRRHTVPSIVRQPASRISLDIYSQTATQNAKIYVFEDSSIANHVLNVDAAQRVHRYLNFKGYVFGIFLFSLCAFWSVIISAMELAIALEVICIFLFLFGSFRFEVEMMRFYLKSFEFWYKWFNWTLYLIARTIWNHLESEMNGVEWTEFVFRNVAITIPLFYIICFDAYNIRIRFKKAALMLLIALLLYAQICNLCRLMAMKPWKTWEDRKLIISTVQVSLSLRTMMMSGLANLIIFTGKQMAVMIRHPGSAAFELFPIINWIGNEEHEDQHVRGLESQSV